MVSPEMFFGFRAVCWRKTLTCQPCISAFLKLVHAKPNETEWFFRQLEELSETPYSVCAVGQL